VNCVFFGVCSVLCCVCVCVGVVREAPVREIGNWNAHEIET